MLLSTLSLCASCLAEDARPYAELVEDLKRLDAQAADTGDATADASHVDASDAANLDAATPEDADTSTGPLKCSGEAGEAIEVTFVNQTDQHADLYWVDSACTEHNLVLIQRGQSTAQQTFVGHVFRLKGAFSRDFLGEIEVTAGQDRVVFE